MRQGSNKVSWKQFFKVPPTVLEDPPTSKNPELNPVRGGNLKYI